SLGSVAIQPNRNALYCSGRDRRRRVRDAVMIGEKTSGIAVVRWPSSIVPFQASQSSLSQQARTRWHSTKKEGKSTLFPITLNDPIFLEYKSFIENLSPAVVLHPIGAWFCLVDTQNGAGRTDGGRPSHVLVPTGHFCTL